MSGGDLTSASLWRCAEAYTHMGRVTTDLIMPLARGAASMMEESGGAKIWQIVVLAHKTLSRHRASVNPSPRPWPGRVSFR